MLKITGFLFSHSAQLLSTNFVLILTGCALGFSYCQPVIYFSVCTQSTHKHWLILLIEWFDVGDLIFITVETLLTDTLVSEQLCLRPPSQKPVTNSMFLVPVSGQLQLWTPFSRLEGFPHTRESFHCIFVIVVIIIIIINLLLVIGLCNLR